MLQQAEKCATLSIPRQSEQRLRQLKTLTRTMNGSSTFGQRGVKTTEG